MRSLGKGVMSATTQVKVSSPEITLVALGQGFHFLETRSGSHLKEARINTLNIPGISVGVRVNSWEAIKRYYLNEKKKFTH